MCSPRWAFVPIALGVTPPLAVLAVRMNRAIRTAAETV
jgi:hypothetical protein